MTNEALAIAHANEGPSGKGPADVPSQSFIDQCPEPEVIAIDFYDSGGEGRIFERLEPGKVGRALLNGKEVWVRQFTLNGKKEVLILKDGNPNQGGNWQTWEVVRGNLNEKGVRVPTPGLDRENIGAIARGFRQELKAAAARRARKMGIPEKRDEGSEEARGNALGIYIIDHIDGSPGTSVEFSIWSLCIRIQGGNLNVGTYDFFSVLEKHLSRLGKIQQIKQPHQISHSTTAFSGKWEGVAFNAIRALAVMLDPIQKIRPRPNLKGTLEVRGEYSNVHGFNFLTFEHRF